MSMRGVAFFVSEGFVTLNVNATLDTLTLTDLDTVVTIIDGTQQIAATSVSLTLTALDSTVSIVQTISATTDSLAITALASTITNPNTRVVGNVFFSF